MLPNTSRLSIDGLSASITRVSSSSTDLPATEHGAEITTDYGKFRQVQNTYFIHAFARSKASRYSKNRPGGR